jgi:protein phosphatase 2C family protein 2/3
VFDGHGGKEVAHYSKNHFENCLKSQPEFKSGDLKEGLRKGFLGIDDLLVNKGGLTEVASLKR